MINYDNSFPKKQYNSCHSSDLLPIEFSKYIQLIKIKMTHKVNLLLSLFSKTRGSPRNPCHG